MVLAGKLRHRVRIEEKAGASTSTGFRSVSWTPKCTVWASVEPLRGREYMEAYKATAPVDTRIGLRALAFELKPDLHRIVHVGSGKAYNVQAVIDPALRGERLEVMCSTGSNDGR